MDTLENKQYKTYDYTCRYSGVPFYYNKKDEKYIMGLGSNIDKNISYTLHEVKEVDTLDSLSLYYYNNPTYWWVIAYFNDIQDAYEELLPIYKTLKIPNIASIKFGDER